MATYCAIFHKLDNIMQDCIKEKLEEACQHVKTTVEVYNKSNTKHLTSEEAILANQKLEQDVRKELDA